MATAVASPAEGEGAGEAKGGGKKKLLILIAIPVLLGGIGAGLWFTGILPPLLGIKPPAKAESAEAEAKREAEGPPPVFVELPEIVANLNTGGRRVSFVKLKARLEVAKPEDAAKVQAAMPRIQDMFQTYIREVRPEDLRGSAGTYRLREELLARAELAARPVRVRDVLFVEMLVQ